MRPRGDLDHDSAGRGAVEVRAAATATAVFNLTRRQAGRHELVPLCFDGGERVEIEADVKRLRIARRVIPLQFHQGEHELLVIAKDHESSGASFQQAFESEEALEEGSEAITSDV